MSHSKALLPLKATVVDDGGRLAFDTFRTDNSSTVDGTHLAASLGVSIRERDCHCVLRCGRVGRRLHRGLCDPALGRSALLHRSTRTDCRTRRAFRFAARGDVSGKPSWFVLDAHVAIRPFWPSIPASARTSRVCAGYGRRRERGILASLGSLRGIVPDIRVGVPSRRTVRIASRGTPSCRRPSRLAGLVSTSCDIPVRALSTQGCHV